MTNAYDQEDEHGPKVGRWVHVPGRQSGIVLEWGKQFGVPGHIATVAVVRLPSGEIVFFDCAELKLQPL